MQFRITFDEIQTLLYRQSSKQIQLLYGGRHTVRVGAEVNVLFKTTSVGIDITVERIEGTDLILSYTGGMGIEMMLKMALGRIKDKPGAEMVELLDSSRIMLHLGRSPQLAQVFERVVLRDIFFDEDAAVIDFTPSQAL
ncbi:MAG: Uncharacterized protein AUK63_163 [bacterium P3]|nr:MAG: Uncharacterized protein AUK63_163 [bacterium P3]KWW42376.1 MAG: Uncharacterized protein F083_280 [bacterium F083]